MALVIAGFPTPAERAAKLLDECDGDAVRVARLLIDAIDREDRLVNQIAVLRLAAAKETLR